MLLNKAYEARFASSIKSVTQEEDASLIIEGYANTISKDRAGDVIPASTWRKAGALQNYKNNPIILAYHNHSKPIGKAIELETTDLGLKIKARISPGAGDVYTLIKDGILSTFSVGFMIKDANYDSATETYFINDVELTEISVVSVPCNQDSTFTLAKSLVGEVDSFKQQFISPEDKPSVDSTGSKHMSEFNLQDLLGQVADTVKGTLAAEKAAADAAKAAADKAAAEKAAAELAAKEAAKSAAASLVAELEAKLKEKDTVFAEAVKAHSAQLAAMKDEIAQVVASRQAPVVALNPVAAGVRSKAMQKREDAEVDAVVMLGIIKGQDMFTTEFGKRHYAEKVNTSSSIQVSSNSYETVFSTNLMRDIQAELVIAPLFEEIAMTAANLTIPINPASGVATWVDAASFGGPNSGSTNAITATLTERTLKTFKLAAKTYLTEETQEDSIIAVLPILRQHLVESHAKAIDQAFLRGTGTNQPKGLIVQAAAIGAAATEVSTATHTGTVKVTAKMLLNARRKLGLYGINLADITLIVSREAYWDLLLDDQWADVQQVGTDAVKLRGEVGNIYGMKVLVSDGFAAKATGVAYAVIVYTKNFVVPRQRDVVVKTDFDVERDRRVFVATQRLNLEPLIEVTAGSGNGAGVVQVTYA